ncbi:hypothetical protein, partial [Wolbachia endosymbiont of Mansonella perstans]|uniref:hypothetical protein n=1 Tax=Wolbachia endosymbiont of Mansonella perstans TaxID=229526 RepID=UPI001CE0D061
MKYPVRTFTGRRSGLQKIYKGLYKTVDEQNAEAQSSLEESFKGLANELNKRLLESPKISITEEGIRSIVR